MGGWGPSGGGSLYILVNCNVQGFVANLLAPCTQATLARLRGQAAKIDAEISRLEAAQEAQVTQVVIEKIRALGIARLPIAEILGGLEKLGASMPQVPPTSIALNAMNRSLFG